MELFVPDEDDTTTDLDVQHLAALDISLVILSQDYDSTPTPLPTTVAATTESTVTETDTTQIPLTETAAPSTDIDPRY